MSDQSETTHRAPIGDSGLTCGACFATERPEVEPIPVYSYTPGQTAAEDSRWQAMRDRLEAGDRIWVVHDGQVVGWLEPPMPLLWDGDQA